MISLLDDTISLVNYLPFSDDACIGTVGDVTLLSESYVAAQNHDILRMITFHKMYQNNTIRMLS